MHKDTHRCGGGTVSCKSVVGKPAENRLFRTLVVDDRIIVRYILRKEYKGVWTAFI
jgi:hypothetical protein